MNTFELLETKRKHVRRYKDIVPDKAIIDKVLYKAWKTTPSKNSSMAYQCLVWGPDKKQEKENIWKVFKDFGKKSTTLNLVNWIEKIQDLGAGEILIQSIDRDGTSQGYDLDLLKMISKSPI